MVELSYCGNSASSAFQASANAARSAGSQWLVASISAGTTVSESGQTSRARGRTPPSSSVTLRARRWTAARPVLGVDQHLAAALVDHRQRLVQRQGAQPILALDR